jgi:hypothetical protein
LVVQAEASWTVTGNGFVYGGEWLMGRHMGPLDPAAGPVERLASELRALRALAGDTPFWKMARHCSASKSALAAAAAGKQLPSENVTREFVRACGGDWVWWRERWAQTAEALQASRSGEGRIGAAVVVRPQHLLTLMRAQLPVPASSGPDIPTRLTVPVLVAGPAHGRSVRRALAACLLIASLMSGGIVWAYGGFGNASQPLHPRPVSSAGPTVTGQVLDGTDPGVVGCFKDKVTLETAHVLLQKQARLRGRILPAGTDVGEISLVYSPHCGGAWARFYPTPGLNPDPDDSTVGATTVEADRPADHTEMLWRMGHIDSTYSGILLTGLGCAIARARVDMIGQNVAAVGRTHCLPHRT